MKLDCMHGYFKFTESKSGQISDYMGLTGLEISRRDDYFTFDFLVDAPNYSLAGGELLNLVSTKTYEGPPWEVFEENGFIYDFNVGLLKPIASVTQRIKLANAGNVFITNGLILPGSLTDGGERIKGYSAWYSNSRLSWYYSAVYYV